MVIPRLIRPALSKTLRSPIGPSPFTPKEVEGLSMWFDVTEISSIAVSGFLVSQINDLSGNGYHLSQGTASAQPTYNSTAINGKPALAFPSGKTLINSNFALNIHSSGYTFFAVIMVPVTASGSGFNLMARNLLLLRVGPAAELNKFESFVSVGGSLEPRVQANLNLADSVSRIVSSSYNATTLTSKVHNSGTIASGTRTPGQASSAGFSVSASNNAAPFLGEMLLFNRDLSAQEKTLIANYLSKKWGIAILN